MNVRCLSLLVLVSLHLASGKGTGQKFFFEPTATTILGSSVANTPLPFTRVFTQRAGELAIQKLIERYENLGPYRLKMILGLIRDSSPMIGYITVGWADQLIRVRCLVDRARSSIGRGEFVVVLEVAEGSDVPAGTVLAEAQNRVFEENGVTVMLTEVEFSPGIVPAILPTGFSVADQVVPDMMRVPSPGKFVAEYTFTSMPPPDGSEPLTHTVREEVRIRRR